MGTMTITATAQQDARIVAAFGSALRLGRNATAAEVKHQITRYIIDLVTSQERAAAEAAARATTQAFDIP